VVDKDLECVRLCEVDCTGEEYRYEDIEDLSGYVTEWEITNKYLYTLCEFSLRTPGPRGPYELETTHNHNDKYLEPLPL